MGAATNADTGNAKNIEDAQMTVVAFPRSISAPYLSVFVWTGEKAAKQ